MGRLQSQIWVVIVSVLALCSTTLAAAALGERAAGQQKG
jgi:hypothetical protein